MMTTRDEEGLSKFGHYHPATLFWIIKPKHDSQNLDEEDTGIDAMTTKAQLLKMFKPFVATLRYVEGLKYTIGNSFISRESQGELLWLDLNTYQKHNRGSPKAGTNYMAFECKDDALWISFKDLKGFCDSTPVVCVNGVPLTPTTDDDVNPNVQQPFQQHQLFFGDIISISVGKCDYHLLFEATSWSPSSLIGLCDVEAKADGEVPNDEDPVIQNPLIVEMILAFQPTAGLKGLRFLSSLWNVECLKVLRNRVSVTPFKLSGLYVHPEDIMQVSSYSSSVMSELGFPHWRIPFLEDWTDLFSNGSQDGQILWKKDMKERKILDDLLWLFNPTLHSHRIKSLRVIGEVASDTSASMLETILAGVQSTLTKLELNLTWIAANSSPDRSDFSFPLLNSLSLSLTDQRLVQPYAEPSLWPFLQRLLRSVGPLLQTLTLKGHWRASLPIVEEIVKLQVTDPRKFATLEHLRIIIGCQPRILTPLASLRVDRLRRMELLDLDPGIIDLRHVLESNVNKLEELTLHFNPSTMRNFGNGGNGFYQPIRINLPNRFPKLKTFSVYLFLIGCNIPRRLGLHFGQGDPPPHLVDDPLKYARHFPSLIKLTVWPVERRDSTEEPLRPNADGVTWRTFSPILTPFIRAAIDHAGHILPVASLRTIDIPFVLSGEYHYRLDDLEVSFPNVTFPPDLAGARLGDVWFGDEDEADEWSEEDDVEPDEFEENDGDGHEDDV